MSIDLLDVRPSEARKAGGGGQRLQVVDCDIHPQFGSPTEIQPFLSERWRDYARTYGGFYRQALANTLSHPRMAPDVARADAWPPGGGLPGSNLEFMQQQHLDPNGVEHGMLMPLNRGPGNQRNLDYGAALASAVNDWQLAYWVDREPRLHASIVVTQEHAPYAVAEIEKRAGDKRFSQIMLPPKSLEPLGRRRYWPIFEAAQAHGLPIALHVGGINGYPSTGAGWPSYYIEEQHSNVQGMQGLVTSLVVEGVFEQFPGLRVVMVEGGIAWMPSLKWRLDKHWKRLKSEAPHLRRAPSEYIHDHIWLTTQPLDEPKIDRDLVEIFEQVGFDRIMFSTDYPHWDFDEPRFVTGKLRIEPEKLDRIFSRNAKELYGLT
jgi:predicted TIM-barrel fold metal-dependent hydrolase